MRRLLTARRTGYAAPYGYNTGYNTGCNAGQMLAVPVIGAAAGILAGQTPTAALLSSLTSTSSLCPAQAAVAPDGYGSPYGTAQTALRLHAVAVRLRVVSVWIRHLMRQRLQRF